MKFLTRSNSNSELQHEARYYARVLTKKLTQLGICYHFAKKKDVFDESVSEVRFSECTATPEALFYRLDTMRLPFGVKLADIDDGEILDDLGVAVGHPVRMVRDINGAWLIVERDSGAFAIPSQLAFSDVLEVWPERSNKQLIVPLGSGANKKIQYRSLAEMPHALIGGATGAGKTTFLHTWICGLFIHNQPDELRLVLVDLKGGTEFTDYRSLPHLDSSHGFIKSPDEVLVALQYLASQVDERLQKFESENIRNIMEWNYRHRGGKLPRLVCVIDELAVIMYDGALRKAAIPLLSDITARGRAPGIHCVLATQRPEVRVVHGQIKGNTDARFAFRMTDNASSMVILDTTEAARFDEKTPRGRFIYRRGIDRNEIQAPLITPLQIRGFVSGIADGEKIEKTSMIPPEQIFRDALSKLNGVLSVETLYKFYGGKASERYLRRLVRDMDGRMIEIDGIMYEVRQEKERQPRKLVLASEMSDAGRRSDESIEGSNDNG